MKIKSRLSILTALCLVFTLLSSCVTGFAEVQMAEHIDRYDDVGEEHWAYPWVTFMTGKDYIHGYPASENDGLNLYKPEQLITRGEFASIIYHMVLPQGEMTETFTDLNEDDWYYEYISKAVAAGYMSGYGDGTIKPKAFITREEATSIVYHAFKIEKYTTETEFVDKADISDWAFEAIMSLAEIGVVVGYTGEEEEASRIQPKTNITRAEVAAILANADAFYPPRVILSEEDTKEYNAETGGSFGFTMFPKNVSDNLSVAITIDTETDYTITYTKDGSEHTVTPEEFAQLVFTADELKNANVKVNFPNAKEGDTINVNVVVTDNAIEGEDKTVGSKTYTVTFIGGEVEPSPTPTTKPIIGGGGGGTAPTPTTPPAEQYTVTYVSVDTTVGTETTMGTESIQQGGYVDTAFGDQTYTRWYTDKDCTIPFDSTTPVTGPITLYAKVSEATVERDRVVEALVAYQSMLNKPTQATNSAPILTDNVSAALAAGTTAYDDAAKAWWTKDMLSIIVTNDRNKRNDNSLADSYYTDIVKGSAWKKVYEDVARYVVDHMTEFSGATVDRTTKFEYIQYFRAMIKTINTAAQEAITAYNNELQTSTEPTAEQRRDRAFAAFQSGAALGLANAITNETLPDTMVASLTSTSAAYVNEIIKNYDKTNGGTGVVADGLNKIKLALWDDTKALDQQPLLDATKLAELLEASLIYPVN